MIFIFVLSNEYLPLVFFWQLNCSKEKVSQTSDGNVRTELHEKGERLTGKNFS